MTDRQMPGWPRAMGVEMAARYLDVSIPTFHTLVGDKVQPLPLPENKRGQPVKRKLYLRDHLDAWLDEQAGLAGNSAQAFDWSK